MADDEQKANSTPSWVVLFASSVAAAIVAGLLLDAIRRGLEQRRALHGLDDNTE